MANCLERLLYEAVTDDRQEDDPTITSTVPATVETLRDLVKVHKLNPNYVFMSQYSMTKRCYGKPLLYLAITFDRADIVELLLSREVGGSPNCSRDPYNFETVEDDPFKRTAIFQSLSMSSTEIFNMLLNAPVSCDALAVDSFNCSLLWHAVNMAHLDKIDSLLKSPYGPKLVNLPDRCCLRPLHVSAINNDSASAELLLSGGAIVDATQYEGASALCIAAKRGAISVLKTLLMHGANPNHSPVDLNTASERQRPAREMAQDHLRKSRGNNALMTPIILAIQSGPFRKTPEQVVTTLAILLACGAILPRTCPLPSYVPESLVIKSRSPSSLQIKCALTIRKALMAKGRGHSVKQLAFNLLGMIPEPLIEFVCFDFLSQF